MKIKKVDHRAKSQPVDNITGVAADDETDRHCEKTVAHPVQPNHEDDDDDRGGERENQCADAGVVEYPKTDPGVAGQHEIEERGQPLLVPDAAAIAEMQQQQAFAEL